MAGERSAGHAAVFAGEPRFADRVVADDASVDRPQIARAPDALMKLGDEEKWMDVRHLSDRDYILEAALARGVAECSTPGQKLR